MFIANFRPFGVLHNDNRLGYPANTAIIVDRKLKVRYLSILEPTVEHSPAEILQLVEQFQVKDCLRLFFVSAFFFVKIIFRFSSIYKLFLLHFDLNVIILLFSMSYTTH